MLIGEIACTGCTLGCVQHEPLFERTMLKEEMRQSTARRLKSLVGFDEVLTTSEFMADQIATAAGGRRPTVVGNPHPNLREFDEMCAGIATANPPEVLFAGNIRFSKGPLVLAECFQRISEAVPGVRFVFAGRGPLEAQIKERAIKAGMADRVEMTGFLGRKAMFEHLARAAVVVAPNLGPEPFGRLPLEAAVARKPIVASAIGGYLETVIDGETGLLVPPGDRSALADAIIRLLMDPAIAADFGDAARQRVLSLFSARVVAARITTAWDHTPC